MNPDQVIKPSQVDGTDTKLPSSHVATYIKGAILGLAGLLSVSCVSTYPGYASSGMNYGGPVPPIYHQPYGQMSTADLQAARDHQRAANQFQRESIKGQRDYHRAIERQREAQYEAMMEPFERFEDAMRDAERLNRRIQRLSRN